MENCVFRMSASHGCTDEKDLVGKFKEALKQRIGEDSYRMWFANGVTFQFEAVSASSSADASMIAGSASSRALPSVAILVKGQFALDRLQKNFLTQLRGAAMQACGSSTAVSLVLEKQVAKQAELDLGDDVANESNPKQASLDPTSLDSSNRSARRRRDGSSVVANGRKGRTTSLANLVSSTRPGSKKSGARNGGEQAKMVSLDQMTFPGMSDGSSSSGPASGERSGSASSGADADKDPVAKRRSSKQTFATFVVGGCNQLAHAAASMAAKAPGSASPMFFFGPSGSGKTHLLSAVADTFRRRYRMRRVVHLTSEQFTNDFVASVGNSGISAFRSRYRDADALLIDDVHFLGNKQATLRELLYTMETLSMANRPMLFSGLQAPTEIRGLSTELAGRMAAGLVCPMQAIDQATRKSVLGALIEQHCEVEAPEDLLTVLSEMATGDGRVLTGLVNNINLLSRMYSRMPSLDEIKRHTGQLLRAARPVPTLSVIENAVCEAFQLQSETLRGGGQTRSVTEPRMLAMYLARQMTSSAYAEIARHFGGKSHSTAISAENNVKKWLENGKTLGRGHAALATQEAIDRVENLLRNVS